MPAMPWRLARHCPRVAPHGDVRSTSAGGFTSPANFTCLLCQNNTFGLNGVFCKGLFLRLIVEIQTNAGTFSADASSNYKAWSQVPYGWRWPSVQSGSQISITRKLSFNA